MDAKLFLLSLKIASMSDEAVKEEITEHLVEAIQRLAIVGFLLSKFHDNGDGSNIREAMTHLAELSRKHGLGLANDE